MTKTRPTQNKKTQKVTRIEKLTADDRRIKNKMHANRTKFTSSKLKSVFWCESGLESIYLHLLERDPNVIRYEVQPFRLHYTLCGKNSYYRPDILLETTDGSIHIKEIKPQRAMEKEYTQTKIGAIKECMEELGYSYEVIDEYKIGSKCLQENVRLLYSYASKTHNEDIAKFILEKTKENNITIEEIIAESPYDEIETIKTIYFLIWHKSIETNLEERISKASTIFMKGQSNDE